MREARLWALTICACLCLLGVGAAGLECGAFLDRIWPKEQATAPGLIQSAKSELMGLLDQRSREIHESAIAEVQATRRALQSEIVSTRRELLTEVNGARQDAVHIAGGYRDLLDKHATRVEYQTLLTQQRIGTSLDGIDALTGQTTELVSQVNDAAPLYLDCDSGMCFANQFYSTSAAIKKTAEAIARETPETAASVKRTSQAIDKIATKFARDKRWYEKVGSALVVGGSIAVRAVF